MRTCILSVYSFCDRELRVYVRILFVLFDFVFGMRGTKFLLLRLFCFCFAATQLAHQLHEECLQVV